MEPVAVIKDLGELVFHAAAKDVRINKHAAIKGVLDNSFRKLDPSEPRVNLGGDEWVNEWPKPSAWDFVAVGKGHPVEYWAEFISGLNSVDTNMICNIEHEDVELGSLEGLEYAAKNLLTAAKIAGVRG
jgi:sugar phosphate isomerase/epimerase